LPQGRWGRFFGDWRMPGCGGGFRGGLSFASPLVQQTLRYLPGFVVFPARKGGGLCKKKGVFKNFFPIFLLRGNFLKSSAGGQLRDIGGKNTAILSYGF